MNKTTFKHLELDNAGKIFPGQNTKRWANLYRMSMQLKEDIDPDTLRVALDKTLDRLPTFKVKMKEGVFSNYYETNNLQCPINHDIKNYCYSINYDANNNFLLRVYYYKKRISIDYYHALCDGYGASVFLCTLTGEYLRLKGHSISYSNMVLDVNEAPRAEEIEDSYERYATSKKTAKLLETPAYHGTGTKLPMHMCNYTAVTVSFKELHALSKSYGVTVTELLAAVILDVLYAKQLREGKSKKDVSVQIPINLRKAFPSESVRNFVICLTVKMPYRKEGFAFDEIVKSVSKQLKAAINYDFMHAYITQTVNLQTKLLKYVPLIVKNTAVKVSFHFGAEFSTSVLLSNLGPINIPEDMKEHVEKYVLYTGPGLVNGARCGVASLGDKLTYTFSNCYKESDIEREFLRRLVGLGLNITVDTNRDEDFGDIKGITVDDRDIYSDEIYNP